MKMKTVMVAGLAASLALVPAVRAALVITDGDFETSVNNADDVASWYDYNPGNFWEGAWGNSAVSPNGTLGVVFSSFQSDDFGTPTSDVNDGCYIYQSIGTADGLTSLEIGFDWGSPTDDGGGRALGLTIGIYAYDGVSGFTAADSTDVRGGAGITLLDSQSYTMTSPGGGNIVADTATLDLAAAGTQELFLRINGYTAGATESWPFVDNVSIIPEPATFGLMGVFGTAALFMRRRFRK